MQSSFIHNSPKLETTQKCPSIKWMDKQIRTKEYSATIKRNKYCDNWKKPDVEYYMLFDSIYMKL